MHIKRNILLSAVLLGAFILSGCGAPPTPEAAQPTEAPKVEQPTTAPAAEKPTEVAAQPSEAAAAPAAALSGQIQLAGSTTVQPLAEKLAGEFTKTNPDVKIDIQGGGTSVGVTSAGDGTVDIGNASRGLKDEEKTKYPELKVFTIAYDGIAVVVNPGVALDNITPEQVRDVFSGKVTNFKDIGGPDAPITVVSREEGSGTRTAFEDLLMTSKDANGKDVKTPIYEKAILQQSNGAVRTTVATTENSIGYLSFGFLDNSTKALKMSGVEATVANVKNGTYKVSRPLIMLTPGEPKPLAKAFIDYILSDAGQELVVKEGYMDIKPAAPEAAAPAAALSGQIQLAGSTTVQPLAEKLAGEFTKTNPDVKIDIQGGGTSVGVTSAGDGTVDIGNASRGLKDEEKTKYPELKVFTIAYDGIAVVVNPGIALDNITPEQVRDVFSGKVTNFKDIGGPDAPITVVSREEGSGTRTAFEDLLMTSKDANGKDVKTPIYEKAILQQSNGAVRTTVATTENSIGYLSFGFLDNSTKALKMSGVEATVANVKNGTYKVSRPLIMLTPGEPKPLAKAFIDYILSDAGQELVVKEGYMDIKK